MKKIIEYHSTDKVYKIKNFKLNRTGLLTFGLISTLILVIAIIISFNESISFNSKNASVNYNETGNVDYKIYLKDNDYYNTSYLDSGMQYVASLIKTVNVKFNYKLDTTEKVSINDNYKIVGELQITERDDPSKVLYKKVDNLVNEKQLDVVDDNIVINEEVDIDYGKYNAIVNKYKKDLGLVVSSNLIVRLESNINASSGNEKLAKKADMQMTIPLSESTLNIKMDSDNIKNSGSLGNTYSLFKVTNIPLFIVLLFLILVVILSVAFDIYVYLKYFKKDIYRATVDKILNDYDRLIVAGKVDIKESRYHNKITPDTFEEMVDAAQNLDVPIMYYEAIPGEKCFFVIVKDDTLYKYRLTKAFLERNPTNKVEDKKVNIYDEINSIIGKAENKVQEKKTTKDSEKK